MNLAQILVDQQRLPEAQAMVERAQHLGHADPYYLQVLTTSLLGRVDDAGRFAEKVCAQWGKDHVRCATARLRMLKARGDIAQARAELDEYVRLHPPADSFACNYMAMSYGLIGALDDTTRWMRCSIDGGVMFAFNPLRLTGRGALLPEELGTDPEWLALWTQPRVREWFEAYRRNVVAYRNGK